MRLSSFNIVHLAAALLLVVVWVVLIIPAMSTCTTRDGQGPRASSQLRGIHQGLVTLANSNKKWFAGINRAGEDEAIAVQQRYQILMEGEFFTPEYAVSPLETDPDIKPWDPDSGEPVTVENYSFAMLQVPEQQGGRRDEWKQSLNSQAIVVSDRNTGLKTSPRSIHNDRGDREWRGSVLWNDNHVGFENEDGFETRYGEGELNEDDRLFVAEGLTDALLVHGGN